MNSKIGSNNTGLRVQIEQSRTRQAPRTDFGSMVGTGLNKTAGAVMDAGKLAAPFIPGGAALSAAISGVGSLKSSAAGSSSGASMGGNSSGIQMLGGSGGSGGTSFGGGSSVVNGTGSTGGAGGQYAEGKEFLEMQASFNMQYLMLQQQMQSENRQFTTLSNIMKTKHDTSKNAINNVR